MKRVLLSTITAALLALPAFSNDMPTAGENAPKMEEHKDHQEGKKDMPKTHHKNAQKNAQKNKEGKHTGKKEEGNVANPEPTATH